MKTDKDELEELLSFKPSKELRIMILEEVKQTGKSVAEIADKYSMPPLFFPKTDDPEEKFEYAGQMMTMQQFHEKYPFKRIVIIRTRR